MAANITPESWAATLLKKLGIRQTPGAITALVGWSKAEGGHWNNNANYNPLNTSLVLPGAKSINSHGVKSYGSWKQGMEATVKTLKLKPYKAVIKALEKGDPSALVSAVGNSPWGTHRDLLSRTVGATPTIRGASPVTSLAGTPTRAPAAPTSTPSVSSTKSDRPDIFSIIENFRKATAPANADPGNTLGLAGAFDAEKSAEQIQALVRRINKAQEPTTTSTPTATPTPSSPSPNATPNGRVGGGPLKELFWQGAGGINVKNGKIVPQGFVDGHTNHVHVASGPITTVRLGKLAQRMGLHVGENPSFGGVAPVHVTNSNHYSKRAIDVSGDPEKMRKYARRVAKMYGLS